MMLSFQQNLERQEIKKIRKAANCIGAAYAFMFVWLWLFELMLISSSGFARFIYNVASDDVYSSIIDIVFSIVVFIPPYILAAKLSGEGARCLNYRAPKKGSFLPLLFMGFGICQIGEIATNMFANSVYIVGIEPVMGTVTYKTGFFGVMMAIISTAVMPALVEEFAMRGVAQGLLRRFGDGFAIFASAVIFGLMHGNLVQAPFAFVVGLGLGFVAVKGGSVFVAVAVHFLNNLVSVGFYYLSLRLDTTTQNAVYACYAAFALLIGVLGFALYKDKGELLRLDTSDTKNSFTRKLLAFFTAPIMVIALILTLLQILQVQGGA
ncbi:MAG: CPBP family intramembrane metalloprotease [Clostridia bacterium]|nr:CPBP family intramembrane metalloprotease [Clostridia bacterium]